MSKGKQTLDDYIEYIAPHCEQLQESKDGELFCNIVDEDLDAFKVVFRSDDVAEIQTKDMNWVALSSSMLYTLIDLITEAENSRMFGTKKRIEN